MPVMMILVKQLSTEKLWKMSVLTQFLPASGAGGLAHEPGGEKAALFVHPLTWN